MGPGIKVKLQSEPFKLNYLTQGAAAEMKNGSENKMSGNLVENSVANTALALESNCA